LTSTLHKLINETNEQLYGLSSTFNQRLTESNGRFETISSTLNQKFYDTQSQLEATTSSLYQRLDEEHAQLEGKSSELNHRLNEAHTTLDGLSSSANYLMGRVEFVRRELMFEMRYGGKAPNSQVEKIKTKVEIINKNKYAAARNNQLRLNLGCGHIALEDYLSCRLNRAKWMKYSRHICWSIFPKNSYCANFFRTTSACSKMVAFFVLWYQMLKR
jgi:hypothetical protein